MVSAKVTGPPVTHLCEFWKIALTICHTNGSFTKSQTYFSFSLVEALFSEST